MDNMIYDVMRCIDILLYHIISYHITSYIHTYIHIYVQCTYCAQYILYLYYRPSPGCQDEEEVCDALGQQVEPHLGRLGKTAFRSVIGL